MGDFLELKSFANDRFAFHMLVSPTIGRMEGLPWLLHIFSSFWRDRATPLRINAAITFENFCLLKIFLAKGIVNMVYIDNVNYTLSDSHSSARRLGVLCEEDGSGR